jgi:hypothetical protein
VESTPEIRGVGGFHDGGVSSGVDTMIPPDNRTPATARPPPPLPASSVLARSGPETVNTVSNAQETSVDAPGLTVMQPDVYEI